MLLEADFPNCSRKQEPVTLVGAIDVDGWIKTCWEAAGNNVM